MSFFRPPATRSAATDIKQLNPEHLPAPQAGSGKYLYQKLRETMTGIPEESIIMEWSSSINDDYYVRSTPSAVAEAFFMHPHDGAVPFFERYCFPLHHFENEYDPEVIKFANRCRHHALSSYVRDSVDDIGAEETLKRIAEGLSEDQALSTQILNLAELIKQGAN